jgi:multiple antibiotic resistance protein
VPFQELFAAFFPLFVAIDIVGLLPIYLATTSAVAERDRRSIVLDATLTGGVVGLGFMFVGDTVLHVLGVTVGDLQAAGGILLLVLAVYNLLHPDLPLRRVNGRIGIMPLGVPMIVGPAVLATLLALARSRGYVTTGVAFILNLAIVWVTLRWAFFVQRLLGEAGAQAVGKVSNLLLAAIAVMMIRIGIVAALRDVGTR